MRLDRGEFSRKRYSNANFRDCGNKKAFPSYRKAAEFNNSIRKRTSPLRHRGVKLEKMHVYRCRNCSQYHIGHPPRTGQKYLHG